MPVLKITRRRREGVFIGRGVHVTVQAITPDVVELLVEAKREIAVTRDNEGLAGHLRRQEALDEQGAG